MSERKNNRAKGTVYEKRAVLFLQKNGYEILERNFYTKFGEIDIIARKDGYLIFVEVKYRKNNHSGNALEAVTPLKQRRILSSAKVYLYTTKYNMDVPCRFDVVAFQGEEIVHIKNAF